MRSSKEGYAHFLAPVFISECAERADNFLREDKPPKNMHRGCSQAYLQHDRSQIRPNDNKLAWPHHARVSITEST